MMVEGLSLIHIFVREAAHYNHDVSKFVTPNVEAALKKKIREGKV